MNAVIVKLGGNDLVYLCLSKDVRSLEEAQLDGYVFKGAGTFKRPYLNSASAS